jgi:hypothetical protein
MGAGEQMKNGRKMGCETLLMHYENVDCMYKTDGTGDRDKDSPPATVHNRSAALKSRNSEHDRKRAREREH